MYQPKAETGKSVKPLLATFVTVSLLVCAALGAIAPEAKAADPSSSPTPVPTITVLPDPSASSTNSPAPTTTPTSTPTPTPTPTLTDPPIAIPDPPMVCGECFNPSLHSIDKFNSLWVVVNKQRPLSYPKYVPKNLSKPPFKYPATHNPLGVQLTKDAGTAIVALATAMANEKAGTLVLSSGYRSYVTQAAVHSRQVARFGLAAGEALAARPGYSEHQTGLAVDVYAAGQGCQIYTCFANTKAGKWLAAHALRFGYIIRYQQNQAATTGYQFEPWHLRYVGVELAGQMTLAKAKSLESFWKLPKAPSYLAK